MPTSVPGNKPALAVGGQAGFTLLELLIVITVIALATGLSVLALRDGARAQLEQEAARLAALLDAARVESRTTGRLVTWRPLPGPNGTAPPSTADRSGSATARDFVFEPLASTGASPQSAGNRAPGLPSPPPVSGSVEASPNGSDWPTRWLHEGTQAEIIGAPRLVLGPEPLIAAQRVRLRRGDQQLILATDGLRGFAVEGTP